MDDLVRIEADPDLARKIEHHVAAMQRASVERLEGYPIAAENAVVAFQPPAIERRGIFQLQLVAHPPLQHLLVAALQKAGRWTDVGNHAHIRAKRNGIILQANQAGVLIES